MVLRVSRTLVVESDKASAQALVAVAIALRWLRRLRAGRSPCSSTRVEPTIDPRTVPACTLSPSLMTEEMLIEEPPKIANTAAATGIPAITPGARATKSKVDICSAEIVATEVTSPSPSQSSCKARSTTSETSRGFNPTAMSCSARSLLILCDCIRSQFHLL